MKLHENQLNLILHLIRLNILSYEDCLKFLDTENTGDMIAMSYVFRPLTKNGYVVKSKDGVVAVLQKGRDLFPEEGPLISVASRGNRRECKVNEYDALLCELGDRSYFCWTLSPELSCVIEYSAGLVEEASIFQMAESVSMPYGET